ncbi:MAG: 6-phosphofructokinase [Anaerolineales bacterium]|nr:6-phosphofructokinase [Anaerolineales bacterium]MCZ2122803.1 6-phosphofructokinase [Anaerolineales bacterium]
MENKKLKLGVLTSGGDAPGMNAAIRAVVRTALVNDMEVVGVRHGYEGLINGEFIPLGARDVGGILQRGGTILLTSRSERFTKVEGQREAIRKMNEAQIDALVVIGGEGSMNGANALAQQGVKVIGIPGSIDNDIWGTNIAIGTDTAMNTIMDSVDKLRDTASSHQRAFLVETMGRNSGYLAMMAGIICGAEMVLIPEAPCLVEEVVAAVEDAYKRGKTHAIIINAEGSALRTTDLAARIDESNVGFSTRITILGHIQRGGSPTAYDRLLASRMGVKAVEALIEGTHGMMTGLKGKGVDFIPLADVISHKRKTNMEYHHMARVLAR